MIDPVVRQRSGELVHKAVLVFAKVKGMADGAS